MFDLQIPINPANIKTLKAEFTKELPEVKSSHRVEAAARGLGFRTYAAMRAAALSDPAIIGVVDWLAFTDYLKLHEFTVLPIHLYRAVARIAIGDVLERMPRLSIFGIGAGQFRGGETPRQHYRRFLSDRQDLLSDHATEAFLLALAFVSRVHRIKTIKIVRVVTGSSTLRRNTAALTRTGRCLAPDMFQMAP